MHFEWAGTRAPSRLTRVSWCQFFLFPPAVDIRLPLCPLASGCLTPPPSMSIHYIHVFSLVHHQNLVCVTQFIQGCNCLPRWPPLPPCSIKLPQRYSKWSWKTQAVKKLLTGSYDMSERSFNYLIHQLRASVLQWLSWCRCRTECQLTDYWVWAFTVLHHSTVELKLIYVID